MKRFRERLNLIKVKRSKTEQDRIDRDNLLEEAQQRAHAEAADIQIPSSFAQDFENINLQQEGDCNGNWDFDLSFSADLVASQKRPIKEEPIKEPINEISESEDDLPIFNSSQFSKDHSAFVRYNNSQETCF